VAVDQAALADAHGVCWDGDRGLLWALGWDRIVAYGLVSGRLALHETHPLPPGATTGVNHGGHDLVAAGPGGGLLVTTVTGAWHFAAGAFTALPALAGRHLKSIAPRPGGGVLAWVEADPARPAIGQAIALGDGRSIRLQQPPYKARWVERGSDGRFLG
jgi:hypothetical protein